MRKIRRLIFFILIMQFPVAVSAQIKMAKEEEPPEVEKPNWWKYKDIMYASYDSSHVFLQSYPTLDAHDKYIGQELFLPSNAFVRDCGCLLSQDHTPLEKSYTKEHYQNKYFTVIDVLSLGEIKDEINGYLNCRSWGGRVEIGYFSSRTKRVQIGEFSFKIEEEIAPYYELKEKESGDIVYTPFTDDFILVGGFLKAQERFIGQYIFDLSQDPWSWMESFDEFNSLIKKRWLCEDVLLYVPEDGKDWEKAYIYLSLKDPEDGSEMKLDIHRVDDVDKNYGRWGNFRTKAFMETQYAELAERIKLRGTEKKLKEERIEENKRVLAQNRAERKRLLTQKYDANTAENIINNNFVIGMSKSACYEIRKYPKIIDRTSTTETWKIEDIFGYTTYLYFNGNKIVRILNP